MKRLLGVLLLLSVVCTALPAMGATAYQSNDRLQAEARKGMEDILDLWRDGRYGELYLKTYNTGKKSKEKFIKELIAAPFRPACCWEKIQEVKVSLNGDSSAQIRARFGLEGTGGTEYRTVSLKLSREDGVWCVNQKDLLALSSGEKKKKRKQYRTR